MGDPPVIVSSTPTYSADVRLRVAQADDRDAVRGFLGRLSQSTVRARYLQPSLRLTGPSADRELNRLLGRNEARHVVMLAVDNAEVRGIGELFQEHVGRAEMGLVVEDAFQGRGIGRVLLRALMRLALMRGIRALTGDMAYGNERAVALLHGTGRQVQTQVGGGGVSFALLLQA
jgi:GNAT superfamily N-acetyltransferase